MGWTKERWRMNGTIGVMDELSLSLLFWDVVDLFGDV
jgi:hypothetical protein